MGGVVWSHVSAGLSEYSAALLVERSWATNETVVLATSPFMPVFSFYMHELFLPVRQLCWEQVLFLMVSVCVSVCLSAQNLENYRSVRCGWKLVTFDPESYFRPFSFQHVYFEWLDLATSFSVWRYIFRVSRSRFSVKVMGPRSRSQQCATQNYLLEIAGLHRGEICCDKAQSNLELLKFWPWALTLRRLFIFFQFKR